MSRLIFSLKALLQTFLWGKNVPPPGWDNRLLLLAVVYLVIVATILAIIPDEPAIHAKLWFYSAMAFGWLRHRRRKGAATAKRVRAVRL